MLEWLAFKEEFTLPPTLPTKDPDFKADHPYN